MSNYKHPGLDPEGRAKRLRDAYDDAVGGLRYIEVHYGRLGGVGWDRVFDAFDKLVKIPEREGLPAGFSIEGKSTQPFVVIEEGAGE